MTPPLCYPPAPRPAQPLLDYHNARSPLLRRGPWLDVTATTRGRCDWGSWRGEHGQVVVTIIQRGAVRREHRTTISSN